MFHKLGVRCVAVCVFFACLFARVVGGASFACGCDLRVFVFDRSCVGFTV